MNRLIECVPNFSEGRDLAKVDAIAAAMSGVPGAWVLDRTSDADHNRSVMTLAGEAEAVAEAAIRGVGKAAELIDLTKQSGAHPRIGATDVLPFIPLEGVSVEECVALARRAAREIWDRYGIPIYFYEAAATRQQRVNLEDVRRGQFEGLREDALRDPDRSPDIGEPRIHPTAGATAVGVRKPLIAYNIHLNTCDVTIAKAIAKAIRFSSGGLRYVKAIGVNLRSRGIAQVSINLTDFEQTPLHRVFEMVKREAERHGCKVVGSEIIGLVPQKAINLSAEYYLQIENFSPARILENRLAAMAGAAALPALDALRETNRKLAEERGSREPGEALTAARCAARDAASASLETALAALELFEQWIQLESVAGPSILSDFRAGRQLALTAARDALDTVDANLKPIPATPDSSSD
jgi:glutamate formiminotransferase